jgi:hypothetical protein
VAFAPVFSNKIEQWLAALARSARGGALLITPAGDIALVGGDVTPDGAKVARTNARRVKPAIDETASFVCDDGSSVFLLAVTEGWVLGVQARDRSDLPQLAGLGDERKERMKWMGLRFLMHHARDDLRLWLAYAHLPHPGGRDSGQSGAPAEVFAERPRKRTN